MNILLTPIGSSGDVHPYLALGMTLRERGHDVTVITNEHFGPLTVAAGLKFVSNGPADYYLNALNQPNLWHPRKGFKTVMDMVTSQFQVLYDLIVDHYVPGKTVVVSHSIALSARVAEEKLGLTNITVHLSPVVFRSDFQNPTFFPGVDMTRMPVWFKRACYRAIDAMMVDPVLCPPLNKWRATLGLGPVSRPLREWIHSPRRVLALFPDWFAPPQPDWPAQMVMTGFPLYDETGQTPAPPGLAGFLQAGDAPIVFTPGSANKFGRSFFDAAVAACGLLGRRGILLTRFPEQVPPNLPEAVKHFDFVPLSQLLHRSAALVHHGGIGTSAQALAAGVPQLIMPLSHDQPDNAARVRRLGAGDWLTPRRFTGRNLARKLRGLIDTPLVWTACKAVAMRCDAQAARQAACDVIERAAGEPLKRVG